MAAPTIQTWTMFPDGLEPNLPYTFSVGFGHSFQLNTTTFKWTQHPTRTNEFYLELAAGGNPAPSITSNAIQAVRAMWYAGSSGRWTRLTRGSTGTGLTANQYDWSDPNSLGYNTLTVRTTDGTTPGSNTVMFEWDESTTGDGRELQWQSIQWWCDRTASADAVAAWPDRYRYVNDPRRTGVQIDLAGVEPTASRTSPVQGFSQVFKLTPGSWTWKARVTNTLGEATTATFTVTVAADSTTEITVGSGGDYATTPLAIAAAPTDDVTIRYLGGHTETLTSEPSAKGSNWHFTWDGNGARPIITLDGTNGYRLLTGEYGLDVDRIAIAPLTTTCQTSAPVRVRRNRLVCLSDVLIKSTGVGNAFLNIVGMQSRPAAGERGMGVLLLNVETEYGQMTYSTGGEAATPATLNPPEAYVLAYGGTLGPSDNESAARQVHPSYHWGHLYVNYPEDDTGSSGNAKDSIRFNWGSHNWIHGCRFTSACRIGQSSAEHHCAHMIRVSACTTLHGSSGGVVSSYSLQPGCRHVAIVNCVTVSDTGGSAGGFTGMASAPAVEDFPEDGYYRHDDCIVAHNSAIMVSGNGDGLRGATATALTTVTDELFENNLVLDAGSWSGVAEQAEDATITGTDTGATAYDAATYVATGASLRTTSLAAFDDLWGNIRGASSFAGSAIAAPPSDGGPDPEPEPVISRGTRKARAVRAVRMVR